MYAVWFDLFLLQNPTFSKTCSVSLGHRHQGGDLQVERKLIFIDAGSLIPRKHDLAKPSMWSNNKI